MLYCRSPFTDSKVGPSVARLHHSLSERVESPYRQRADHLANYKRDCGRNFAITQNTAICSQTDRSQRMVFTYGALVFTYFSGKTASTNYNGSNNHSNYRYQLNTSHLSQGQETSLGYWSKSKGHITSIEFITIR